MKKLLILFSLILFYSGITYSATINVPGDQPTIQAAINAAVDGDIIQIAAGTYIEALSVGKSLTFIGSGPASLPTTIITSTANPFISLTVTGKSYTFQNLIIEGNVTNNGIRAGGAININSLTMKDFIGRNCQVALYLAEYYTGGVFLTTTVNNLNFDNVTLTNNKFIGAYIGKTVLSGTVTNSTITGNGYSDELPSSWQKTGLQFVNFDEATVPHVVVTNSNFSNNGTGASNIERTGLIIYTAYNAFTADEIMTVSGCSFTNHPQYAVRIKNGYNVGNTATVNGTFSGNYLDIWFNNIIGTTSSTTLVRRTFTGTKTVGPGPTYDYNTIQAAVDAAVDGDIIAVAAGTYDESIDIQKPLSLLGAGASVTSIDRSANATAGTVVSIHDLAGNVTLDGFTIKTGPASTVASNGIHISALTGTGTISITNNVIWGVQSATQTAEINYGLIAGYFSATTPKLIFDHNIVHGGSDNPILIERWMGPTEITNNTLYQNPLKDFSASDVIFMMNYGGSHNTQRQLISGNTIDMGWGTTNQRGAGISISSSYTGGTTLGGFTYVEITNNDLINLKPNRRGISTYNNSSDGTGGDITNAIISGNTISNATSYSGEFGIRVLGKATGTQITNNTINGVTDAVKIQPWNSHEASNTQVNNNSLIGVTYGLNNLSGILVNAEDNWWGTVVESQILAMISGIVDFDPWIGKALAYNAYLSSGTIAAAGIIYPNDSWGNTPYEPAPPAIGDDWDFTAPITLYIVPEVGSVFGASDITIQWDNTMFSYGGVDKTGGIYDGVLRYFNTLPAANQVVINAGRLDNTNFYITSGQYIAILQLNLLKPGFGPINFSALDFRAFDGIGGQLGVVVTGNNAQVKSYLGDVASTSPSSVTTGDGLINFDDLTPWSLSYWSGVGGTGMANYKVKYDVGPTSTGNVYGIPAVNGQIQFEDLVIFSMSYGLSAGNIYPKIQAEPTAPVELQLGEPVIAGNQTRVPLFVSGGVQNVRAMSLTFAGQFGKLVSVEKGTLLTEFINPVMVMSNTDGNQVFVDLAVFGAEEVGINTEGEVLTLIFEGNTEINLNSAEVRNIVNNPMAVNISGTEGLVPAEFALMQNYPNPFNPSTTINYNLPKQAMVEISIYNALGERVAMLVNEIKEAGRHTVEFNASGYSSGIYFYQIKANDFVSVKKMILLK